MKKKPTPGVVAFEVHTSGVKTFRRAGLLFTDVDQTVEAKTLSEEQQIALLNTPTLVVTEIMGEKASKK